MVLVPKLVRLRADPSKVRVSIRKAADGWEARIAYRLKTSRVYVGTDPLAEYALRKAYERAERAKVPGLDPNMGWTYDHPHERVDSRVYGTREEREELAREEAEKEKVVLAMGRAIQYPSDIVVRVERK